MPRAVLGSLSQAPQAAGVTVAVGIAVTASTSLAFVAGGPGGLRIIDISRPAAPKIVGGYVAGGVAYHAAASGSHAYLG